MAKAVVGFEALSKKTAILSSACSSNAFVGGIAGLSVVQSNSSQRLAHQGYVGLFFFFVSFCSRCGRLECRPQCRCAFSKTAPKKYLRYKGALKLPGLKAGRPMAPQNISPICVLARSRM